MALEFIVFITVITVVTGSLHLYLYRRLVRDTTTRPGLRRLGQVVAIGLWLVLLGGPFFEALLAQSILDLVNTGIWFWMGVAIYLWLALATAGLIWLGVRTWKKRKAAAAPLVSEDRRLFLSRTIAGGALVAAGGASTYGVWRAYTAPEIEERVVKLPRLPKALEGFTIVQVTDIHVGPLVKRRFMDDMVARCNALRPDLVAITGDLVDGDVPTLGHAVAALANLKAGYGSWFVTGNHEYYSGHEEWCAELARQNVGVLRNQHVRIGEAGASFELIGVDDWRGDEDRRYDLDAALAGATPDAARVLLSHQPANFREAVKRGVGLQLSGHTHGGQMFPMNLLIPIQWEYAAGLYRHEDAHIYVSRGTGFWGPPLRVGSPPEISRIVLVSA